MKNTARKIRNGLIATAAGTALAFGTIAPAQAHTGHEPTEQQVTSTQSAAFNDVAISVAQTGGVRGFFGRGHATVTNTGNTTIPAGVVVDFRVAETHHGIRELHAITLVPQNFGKMATFPITLNQGQVRTTAPLAPGESASFNWTVFHYGFWHRVSATVSIAGMPEGVHDQNPHNNVVVADNNGRGI